MGDVHLLLSRNLLEECAVPSGIDEIWTTHLEFFDDESADWVYERAWLGGERGVIGESGLK